MTLPTIHVEIDFANGPSFAYPFVLDSFAYGILGTNILADQPSDIIDVTSQVRRVSTRRGRNRILANFEAGTATVVLNDPNSDFNPQNTSSPYYGKLLPLRKIRIYATTIVSGSPIDVNIFSGYITSYDTSFYQGTNEDATITLQCADGFRLLSNVSTEIPPIPGTTVGQTTGSRVGSILEFAEFPESMWDLETGDTAVQADPGGNRSVLQAIQTVEQSEFGAFFMARDGRARFLDRTTVSKLSDTLPRVYSDNFPLAPNTYPYSSVDFAFDDQLVLNDVSITRLGGTPQIVTDPTSIATYFYKSGQRTNLLMQTDAEALDQAQMLVASRKNATLRIDSMLLNLNSDIDETNTLINLSLDIYTLINITKEMPGGSTVTQELFVQGVNHDISPGQWNITVYTAEPIIQAFILDSSTQGLLDTNSLTY
jgi:hypothetical protein